MKDSLSAVETLYTLALFKSHEPDFSTLFHTLPNVQSQLKAQQCNALKNSKITSYFENMETKENGATDSETNAREVILVD